MTRKTLISAVVGVAAFTFGATASAYAVATTLKLSHNHPRGPAQYMKRWRLWRKEVRELTDGEVRIRIYPDAQLGTQRESMELMQNGALDMVKSNAAEL